MSKLLGIVTLDDLNVATKMSGNLSEKCRRVQNVLDFKHKGKALIMRAIIKNHQVILIT